jgi:hypothetical protein
MVSEGRTYAHWLVIGSVQLPTHRLTTQLPYAICKFKVVVENRTNGFSIFKRSLSKLLSISLCLASC